MSDDTGIQTGIQQALNKFDGSPTQLAKAAGGTITRQNIEYWQKKGVVPAAHAPLIEKASGIVCEVLTPGTDWSVIRGIKQKKHSAKRAPAVVNHAQEAA